jgi:hypothetical protein
MRASRKILIAAAGAATAGVVAAWAIRSASREQIKTISGVVLRQDAKQRNQVGVADAEIRTDAGTTKSNKTGLFHLNLQPHIHVGEVLPVAILHSNYETLDMTIGVSDELYVFYLKPVPAPPPANENEVTVNNPRVRYDTTETSTVSVGSAAETFDVVNQANIPCNGMKPCSPDGKWKAAISGKTLDAGDENVFEDVRVTCIAGPCPFTRIEKDGFSDGGRHIEVQVRNWSDTTTFLLEAEVTHTMTSDSVRLSYPARFADALDFTLPLSAEGPSIEATVGGEDIIFPISPTLELTWATCSVTPARDGTKLFHCDLKRGYRLQ